MTDTLRSLTTRLIAISILGFILAASYFVVARPVWQSFRKYHESISLDRELIQRFNSAIIDADVLEKQRAEAVQNYSAQTGLLRGSNEAVAAAFMQQLVTSAVEAEKGSMRSIQILPVAEQGGFRKIVIRAQMSLTTAGLRGALYRIETSQPFMFVTDLDVRQGPQIQLSNQGFPETPLLVRFDIYGFIRPPPPLAQGS